MDAVFIIDDNKEFRKKCKKMFKEVGLNVIEAPDALGVAEILMREKENIGVVLLDIQIPDIDGRGVYDLIQDYTTHLPIIVCSVLPVNDQKLRIPRARDYYQKRGDESALLNKVSAILQH